MRTLVVLPGWEQDKRSWEGIKDALPEMDVRVLELPGFGAEALVSGEWGIPEYADWAEDRIGAMGLDEVIILGHSFGGRVAALLASRQPLWLKGLVLYGAPCLYRPSAMVSFRINFAKLAKRVGVRKVVGNEELLDAEMKGLGRVFRNAVIFDQTDSLPLIAVPTLLIWGEQDTEVPLHIAHEMKQLIAGSELIVLDKVGHNAHLENAGLFFGTVRKWLDD